LTANDQRRVLLVDDDPDVRNILSYVLRQQGLSIDAASHGGEALDFLREHRYGVVLLDLMMPDVDGFHVLDAIYAGVVPDPPVVLVVSGADGATLKRLDAKRIHGIVRKPFDPNELASVVTACIDIRARNTFGTMAMAMISSAPIIALLKL
jgi:CheY-like chemotaxis protein